MKKVLAFMLVLLMSVALVACGDDTDNTSSGAESETSVESEVSTASEAEESTEESAEESEAE